MPYVIDEGGDSFTAGDPAHGVCIAFDDVALEPDPVWTRLDDPAGYRLAVGWSISRGRQSELEKTGTGTASVVFKDSAGILDPTNTASPFYDTGASVTKLDPMKQAAIALMNPVTGVWYSLFRGFVSENEHDLDMWSNARGLDTSTMEFEDAFGPLAALDLTPGDHGDTPSLVTFADVYYQGTPSNFPGEADVFVHVDDRINKVLDDAGWPSSLRNIFSGNVSVQGKVYERADQLLAALFDAADAEFPGLAVVFASKDGIVTFHGRYPPFFPDRPAYGINTWKVGGMPQALADPTVAPLAGLRFRRSKSDILNSVVSLPQGVDDTDAPGNLVTDATSISTYGRRSDSFDNLQTSAGHNDDASPTTAVEETKKFADYTVGNLKDPKTRVSMLRFRSRGPDDPTAPALWDLMCRVELGDVIELETSHPGGGGFDETYLVQGIRYEASGARADYHDITLELDVSPRSQFAYNPFGEVDDGNAAGKVLKAVGDSTAQFDFLSDETEVWVSFRLAMDADSLAAEISGAASGSFVDLRDSGFSFIDGVYLAEFSPGEIWNGNANTGSAPVPVADTWMACEFHYDGATGLEEFYVDGDLVFSGTGAPTTDVHSVLCGLSSDGTDPPAVAYIDDVKIGTTRGGSEIFSDDFESGDLSAWTTLNDDVSVVDDPF